MSCQQRANNVPTTCRLAGATQLQSPYIIYINVQTFTSAGVTYTDLYRQIKYYRAYYSTPASQEH